MAETKDGGGRCFPATGAKKERKLNKLKKMITPEFLAKVEVLSECGFTRDQMHWYFGLSNDTWSECLYLSPELQIAVKRGLTHRIEIAVGKLWEKVIAGNLSAIVFFLKTQARWRETDRPGDVIPTDGDPIVQKFPSITLTIHDPVEASKIYQQIMIGS
jgi:hypothetical protein